jgi:hypothetical protein
MHFSRGLFIPPLHHNSYPHQPRAEMVSFFSQIRIKNEKFFILYPFLKWTKKKFGKSNFLILLEWDYRMYTLYNKNQALEIF